MQFDQLQHVKDIFLEFLFNLYVLFVDFCFAVYYSVKPRIFVNTRPKHPALLQSATQTHKDIIEGKHSCADVMEAFIERLEEVNPIVNGICAKDYGSARLKAKAMDDMLKNLSREKRNELSIHRPFFGIPITVKNNIDVKRHVNAMCLPSKFGQLRPAKEFKELKAFCFSGYKGWCTERLSGDQRFAFDMVVKYFEEALDQPVTHLAMPHEEKLYEMCATSVQDGLEKPYCDIMEGTRVSVWNAFGMPVIAVPLGLSGDGLPLSVQIVGSKLSDLTLLRMAEHLDGHLPKCEKPQLFPGFVGPWTLGQSKN
ncbi:unnamed protein product, partial [Mesorhabditis spiculigera]